MKIGIVTQPLHTNYGGLLQAYALQKFLKKIGHEVLTVDLPGRKPRFYGAKSILVNCIKKYLLGGNVKQIFPLSQEKRKVISTHTNSFIKNNISRTILIPSVKDVHLLSEYNFEAYVVGSDQVWRPLYSPGLLTYFLDFVDDKTKKISYAASFGTDHCNEYKKTQITKCSALLKKFNAISVREDSGVDLCRKYFGVSAAHVLDPTLLLDKEYYIDLMKSNDGCIENSGNMMVYLLDDCEEKNKIVKQVADVKNLKPYTIMPSGSDGIYPSVGSWLKGFFQAEFVVTDSFHGVVFSILFNKEFIVIGNNDRGLARFESILNKFNLSDRMIHAEIDFNIDVVCNKIDFNRVNITLDKEREIAKEFIVKALGE